jgi:hypothetical protein
LPLAFTDVLIELSDPQKLALFRRNPEEFLKNKCLNAAEKDALLSGDRNLLRLNARSTDSTDESQQFNRILKGNPMIPVVGGPLEAHIDLNVQAQDQIAIAGSGVLFVDANGALFKAVSESDEHVGGE